MFLPLAGLQHINSITHEGKLLVFATDGQGLVWYSVRRDGFEAPQALGTAASAAPATPRVWEDFTPLQLPNEAGDDSSVIARELATLTVTEPQASAAPQVPAARAPAAQDSPRFLLRSRYRTRTDSAVAPVQLVSGFGHVYVFRQSKAGSLLVDRFVLDGLTNTLRPKLEVRFKRSRKRHAPEKPASSDGRLNFDALHFRDVQDQPFFEPTTELALVKNLRDGWFSVVLLPTDEHEHFCWHIFAFNTETEAVELTTLAASDNGLFHVYDGRVAGIVHRKLIPLHLAPGDDASPPQVLPVQVSGAPVATRYDVQRSKAGAQWLRLGTRVMLAVPTAQGVVAIDFAAAGDGTLSRLDEDSQRSLLRFSTTEVTLPPDTLDDIRASSDTAAAGGPGAAGQAQGRIAALKRGDGERLLLQTERVVGASSGASPGGAAGGPDTPTPLDDSAIRIQHTLRLDGLHQAQPIVMGALREAALGAAVTRLRLKAPLAAALDAGQRLAVTDSRGTALVSTLTAVAVGRRTVAIVPVPLDALAGAVVTAADAFTIAHPAAANAAANAATNAAANPGAKPGTDTGIGTWQEVSKTPAPVLFDGIVTAVARQADGRLRVQAFNHGLQAGELVQLTGMVAHDGVWPVERIDGDSFLLDVPYLPGTAINLRLQSHKRRGLRFEPGGASVLPSVLLPVDVPAPDSTLECWFKTRSKSAGILQFEPKAAAAQAPARQLFLRHGELVARLGHAQITTAGLALDDGQWHHLAHVVGPTVGGQQLWVDGVLRPEARQLVASAIGSTDPVSATGATALRLGFGEAPAQIEPFAGDVSELRLWNLARTPQQISAQRALPLLGRETGLVGYWRLGAIVEGATRTVVDFSPFEHDGLVSGDVHLGAHTLPARLRDRVTPVTAYRNDELVAVTAGARYEESFEFRLRDQAGNAVVPPLKPVTPQPPVFKFVWQGKRSRSADDWITLPDSVDTTPAIAAATGGWFKATGRFTLPEDSPITLLRTFGVNGVQSQLFAEMDVRRHQLRQIADAVTLQSSTESFAVHPLGRGSLFIDATMQILTANELEETVLVERIRRLEQLLALSGDKQSSQQAFDTARAQLADLKRQSGALGIALDAETADRRNHQCRLFWTQRQLDGSAQRRFLRANFLERPSVGEGAKLELASDESKASLWSFPRRTGADDKPDGTDNFSINATDDATSAQVSLIVGSDRRVRLASKAFLGNSPTLVQHKFWHVPNEPEDFSIRTDDRITELLVDRDSLSLDNSDADTRHPRWGVQKTQVTVGARIADAQRDLKTKQDEVTAAQQTVDMLEGALQSEAVRATRAAELKTAQDRLAEVQAAIRGANETLISASQPDAQPMPVLKTDARGLKTTGALLGFLQSAGRLSLMETCDGNVQLACLDASGRMRLALYDACADGSVNSSFEQWLQDQARQALHFRLPQAKVLLPTPVPLRNGAGGGDEWTIEAWFFHDPNLAPLFRTLVAGRGGDALIVIAEGRHLGWRRNLQDAPFLGCEFNVQTLATGWHHLTAVGKGRGVSSTTLFYIDGRQVGDVKAIQLDLLRSVRDKLTVRRNLASAAELALRKGDLAGAQAKSASDLAATLPQLEKDLARATADHDSTLAGEMRSHDDVACIGNSAAGGQPFGKLAELRIWGLALSDEEIEVNSRTTLSGNEPGLLAYYPFNGDARNKAASGSAFDGDNVGGAADPWGCAAPIGHPAPGSTVAKPSPSDAVVSAEYVTYSTDPATGARTAMMRRFFAAPAVGGVSLLAHKRIEELDLRWIGNTQFKPTLLGYIEGAPPVPSENLTVEPASYNGATSVELAVEDAVSFSWNREDSEHHSNSIGGFSGMAWSFEASPLFVKAFETSGRVGFRGGQDITTSTANQSAVSASTATSLTDRLALRGHPESEAHFPHLGRRFVPKNIGYALVVSGLADVFVTQLKRSGRMVSYEVRPVADIPPDVNTITFLINPAYTMNGSLDGLTGSQPTSDRFFPQVAQMRAQYGAQYPASYYRLRDAYQRKAQIEKRDQERAAYFANFSVDLSAQGFSPGSRPALDPTEDTKGEAATARLAQIKAAADGQQVAHSSAAQAVWQKKMERILAHAGKRNIVNTYVWDADGGLHAESQQFASTIEHTIGGAYESDFKNGLDAEFLAVAGFGVSLELNYMNSQRMSQTLSKTESRSEGFALLVDLSGVEHQGITDFKDRPCLPGEKVDRYRFMSFYLEGDTSHFNDFFNEVVDPEWLAGNDEEARALRQVDQSKANKSWRVLHRVTYVERPALAAFGRDVRTIAKPPTANTELADLAEAVAKLRQENKLLRGRLDTILARLG